MFRIVLDTNFLLEAAKNPGVLEAIDKACLFKYDLNIVIKTLDELKGKKNEKIAKGLIKHKNIDILEIESNKNVDGVLLDLSSDKNTIIATLDKKLRQKLEGKKAGILTLRQGKYAVIRNVL